MLRGQNWALELLHSPDTGCAPASGSPGASQGPWRRRRQAALRGPSAAAPALALAPPHLIISAKDSMRAQIWLRFYLLILVLRKGPCLLKALPV